MLAPAVETEIASLAARYGQPRRVTAELDGWQFSPLTMEDRYGEVCMVVRRPNGRIITAKKAFYPAGAFRLLTGGVDHGEPIADALLREVAEETGLDVVVRSFMAVIEYRSREIGDAGCGMVSPSPIPHPFATFAFLLDEIGGTLHAHDPGEQIEAFRELELAELPGLAETLESLPDLVDPEIDGSWRDWGRYRAVGHRVIYQALSESSKQ
ncbi:MAG TPA: NUDIX hydrolase [Roseiflexaceae bacterium]|nr:NUDIX hydrolase [Roseiflexaceae bacterium]